MGNSNRSEYKDDSGKGWCVVLILVVVIVIIVIVALALTVFRVRDPKVTAQSFQLQSFSLTFLAAGPQLSFVLNTVVAVRNRNHASFKYQSSTAYLYYRGIIIGSAPLAAGKIGSETTTAISTQFNVAADSFLVNPNLAGDIQSGTVPLVVTTTLHGKIDVATIVKHHATAVGNCNLSIFIQTQSVGQYSCTNKLTV